MSLRAGRCSELRVGFVDTELNLWVFRLSWILVRNPKPFPVLDSVEWLFACLSSPLSSRSYILPVNYPFFQPISSAPFSSTGTSHPPFPSRVRNYVCKKLQLAFPCKALNLQRQELDVNEEGTQSFLAQEGEVRLKHNDRTLRKINIAQSDSV